MKEISKHRNILMIQEVVDGLGDLKESVAFVGGATVALYLDDKFAPMPTPSDDVDFVVEIASLYEYSKLEEVLRNKGFKDPLPERGVHIPICRKVYKGIQVDIMPTDEKILGFSNRWYREAMKHRVKIFLPNGNHTYILNVVYFIATKLEAFNSRGKSDDIRFSHDLEDILTVLDGCSYIEERIESADSIVRNYIKEEFRSLLEDAELLEEAATGFIRAGREVPLRAKRIVQRMQLLST